MGGATGRIHGASHSLLDYNRAGVPLVEIVTKTISGAGDRAPEVARAYVTALRDLLKSLDVSDVRMDQGSMRCDANVSLMPIGATELGTRTETKNVNSLKSVEVAVRYEMRRQAAVLEAGGPRCIQETRHFQEADGTRRRAAARKPPRTTATSRNPISSRSRPARSGSKKLRGTLPELPWVRRARIQADWGISDEVMRDLVNAGALDLVIATVDAGAAPEAARSWWGLTWCSRRTTRGVELDELPITPGADREGGEARSTAAS